VASEQSWLFTDPADQPLPVRCVWLTRQTPVYLPVPTYGDDVAAAAPQRG
jgi:hypothetical protein